MNKSESIKSIAAALAKFQAECGTISKTANNPFFKSKYAPLSEILEQISTPLKNSGLAFSQFPDGDSLTTILMHPESGEWMEASYNMHPAKSDPQSVGSAISYARRYALGAILALNIDDDDDGNASSQPVKPEPVKSELPWLNKYLDKERTKLNPKYGEVVKYLKGGGLYDEVLKKYQVFHTTKAELDKDIA